MNPPDQHLTLESCVLRGDVIQLPKSALIQEHVFRTVFSDDTWKRVISEEDRQRLREFLPPLDSKEQDTAVHRLFNLQNIKFGNPLKKFHKALKRNHLSPENFYYRQLKRKSMHKAYKQRQLQHQTETLENLLLLRQRYLEEIQVLNETDITEKLNPKWRGLARETLNEPKSDVDRKAKRLYKTVTGAIKRHCGDDYDSSSDDDVDEDISEIEVQVMLSRHHHRRANKEIAPTLDTRGTNIGDIIDRVFNNKTDSDDEYEAPSLVPPAGRTTAMNKNKNKHLSSSQTESQKKAKLKTQTSQAACQMKSKAGLIPYQNVLGLLKMVMANLHPPKEMNEAKISQEMNEWQQTDVAKLCLWASAIPDWTSHVADLLNALIENKETPLVERTPSENWKWIGEGHDSKLELNTEWTRIMPAFGSLMGDTTGGSQSDDEIPESQHGDTFHKQESMRFGHPHRCYTYRINSREYLVGPVKGVYEKVSQNSNNKAREHALLINDRPSYVTILTLVRDAAARLPKGEGTRYEICDLLKDSQFISESATDNHINTVVSGALDRLHYEKDPCVKFDSAKKNWVYLHGDRTAEEFEMLHKAQGAAQKAKKAAKPSKSLQAAQAAAAAASAAASKSAAIMAEEKYKRTTWDPATPQLVTESPRQSRPDAPMDVDMMNTLISAAGNATLPASVVSHMKPQPTGKPPPSHQMRAIKLEPGDGGRLMGVQITNPGQVPSQEKQLPSNLQLARQISLPNPSLANQKSVGGVLANQRMSTDGTTPTLITTSNLPKGAVFYQRIPSQGQQGGTVMQKVLTGSPAGGNLSQGGAGSTNPTLMHRIVGSPKGGPVQLARLVQTQGGQKFTGGQQQQYTHVQLPGGERVALPIGAMGSNNPRSVQIVSTSAGSEAGNRTTNVVQVQNISGVGGANRVNVGGAHRINMGGASRPVGVARSTSVQAVRTGVTGTQQQTVSNQIRVANLQKMQSTGRVVATSPSVGGAVGGAKPASLLTQQSDGKGGQVQLVKALISEGRQGSQAYILTTNSGQTPSMLSNKSVVTTAGGNRPAMIARVLQPDGTLTTVPQTSAGSGRSILTTVTSAAAAVGSAGGQTMVKRTSSLSTNPVIVRQISIPTTATPAATQGQSSNSAAATIISKHPQIITAHGGEIPRRIEKSELSPSTELDVETDM